MVHSARVCRKNRNTGPFQMSLLVSYLWLLVSHRLCQHTWQAQGFIQVRGAWLSIRINFRQNCVELRSCLLPTEQKVQPFTSGLSDLFCTGVKYIQPLFSSNSCPAGCCKESVIIAAATESSGKSPTCTRQLGCLEGSSSNTTLPGSVSEM